MDYSDTSLKMLRAVENNPNISQRELAAELGISLGKANYCLKALLDKGWVKMRNFRNSGNKLRYAYLLTPQGVEQKGRLTVRFLALKLQEYERLKEEIEYLKEDLKSLQR